MMSKEKGKPTKRYPQVSLTREVYNELWDLKFNLKKNSLNDLLEYLIKEHKDREQKDEEADMQNE